MATEHGVPMELTRIGHGWELPMPEDERPALMARRRPRTSWPSDTDVPRKFYGTTLRQLRRWAGMTQIQLAARLGVDNSTVSRWEANENAVPIATIERIEALFADPAA
ncbi:MAG: helix-turn-helix domain-containing protein [Chloroflexota bacterium]|nr:helix-turn-helix domain-containing protein [Chloroflexota bacterium]